MELITTIISFLTSPTGAAIGFGLWVISEALASIPAIQANGVFQLIHQFLSRFKRTGTPVILFIALLFTTGCGKTLDQIKQVAHGVIDVAGKVYEDAKDNVNTAKDAVTPAKK